MTLAYTSITSLKELWSSIYNMCVQAGAIIYVSGYCDPISSPDTDCRRTFIEQMIRSVRTVEPFPTLTDCLHSPFSRFVRTSVPRRNASTKQLTTCNKTRGNRVLISICSMNIVLYIFTFFFYRTINNQRERIWSSWTTKVGDRDIATLNLFGSPSPSFIQQQTEYLETTKDEGNKRMDFRFAY
jgi:hypothetical protein